MMLLHNRTSRTALLLTTTIVLACGTAAAQDPARPASAPATGVIGKVEQAIGQGVSAAASGVRRGVQAAARGAEVAASGVQRGASAAARGVQKGARATANAVETAASKVGLDPAPAASAAR